MLNRASRALSDVGRISSVRPGGAASLRPLAVPLIILKVRLPGEGNQEKVLSTEFSHRCFPSPNLLADVNQQFGVKRQIEVDP